MIRNLIAAAVAGLLAITGAVGAVTVTSTDTPPALELAGSNWE